MKASIAMLAALLLGAATPATPAATVDDLGWLAGTWVEEGEGRWTEESWTDPRGGVMLGHSRSGRGDALREFEFLRLQAGEDGAAGLYRAAGRRCAGGVPAGRKRRGARGLRECGP
ncbi:DUF6265 family protein [Sphingopyxis sp. PET50]|uniref:DUF6265 family protein n=1 Tax=Sphingopyxis sp. PET50 TaxID=2976533 RepID=UPI0021AFA0D9|nr:DUF6265 family protein [Sphingopyxis sp. PET50]